MRTTCDMVSPIRTKIGSDVTNLYYFSFNIYATTGYSNVELFKEIDNELLNYDQSDY